MKLLQQATTAASTGLVSESLAARLESSGKIRSNPTPFRGPKHSGDAVATAWTTTQDPIELADMAEIVGRITAHNDTASQFVYALLLAYSQHYAPYEKGLIQRAVKISRDGTNRSHNAKVLLQHLNAALHVHVNHSLTWIPLQAAQQIVAHSNDNMASHIRSFAGMEESKAYPFNRKYIAVMFHKAMPPVTSKEVVSVIHKVQRSRIHIPKKRTIGTVRPNPRRR